MPMNIPSPVLARLQIMFSAGASVAEVAKALEIDVAGVAPDRLDRIRKLAGELQGQVDALLEMDRLRELPDIAGAIDLIAQQSRAIQREAAIPELERKPDSVEPTASVDPGDPDDDTAGIEI